MESKVNYAWVGGGVVVLTLILVGTLFWLTKGGSTSDLSTFVIFFKEQSLEGLQKDSNVTMKGIKVGSVGSFRISHQDIERVRVEINVSPDTPVKMDTRAVIKRNLLTGLAYIDLIGSSQQSPLLLAAQDDERFPVIPEGQSDFKIIQDSVPNVLENVSDVLGRIKAFFSEENLDSVQVTLKNVATLSDALAGNEAQIRGLVTDTSQMVKDLRKLTNSLAKVTEEGNFPELGQKLSGALGQISAAVSNLDQRTRDLTAIFRASAQSIIDETSTLSQELVRAAQAVSATMERFEEPKALIVGPNKRSLGPGEVIQK